MLREKRISKPPVSSQIFYPEPKKHPQKAPKKFRKHTRCEYQVLPFPTQMRYDGKVHRLFGDIIILEKSGSVWTDLSMLTMYKSIRTAQITKKGTATLIEVGLEEKGGEGKEMDWKKTIEEFQSSGKFDLCCLSSTLEQFYHRVLDSNKTSNQDRKVHKEKDCIKINTETEAKITKIMESMPGMHIKYRLDQSAVSMKDIIFNEDFIQQLGFSRDMFVTQIFQEGLPQMSACNSNAGKIILQTFFEHYYKLSQGGFIIPDISLVLMMKNGYAKKVRMQVNFLPFYEEGRPGMDLVLGVIHKEDPYLDHALIPNNTINHEFIDDKIKKEQSMAAFLKNYYQASFTQRYTHFGKTCTIKELPIEIHETH